MMNVNVLTESNTNQEEDEQQQQQQTGTIISGTADFLASSISPPLSPLRRVDLITSPAPIPFPSSVDDQKQNNDSNTNTKKKKKHISGDGMTSSSFFNPNPNTINEEKDEEGRTHTNNGTESSGISNNTTDGNYKYDDDESIGSFTADDTNNNENSNNKMCDNKQKKKKKKKKSRSIAIRSTTITGIHDHTTSRHNLSDSVLSVGSRREQGTGGDEVLLRESRNSNNYCWHTYEGGSIYEKERLNDHHDHSKYSDASSDSESDSSNADDHRHPYEGQQRILLEDEEPKQQHHCVSEEDNNSLSSCSLLQDFMSSMITELSNNSGLVVYQSDKEEEDDDDDKLDGDYYPRGINSTTTMQIIDDTNLIRMNDNKSTCNSSRQESNTSNENNYDHDHNTTVQIVSDNASSFLVRRSKKNKRDHRRRRMQAMTGSNMGIGSGSITCSTTSINRNSNNHSNSNTISRRNNFRRRMNNSKKGINHVETRWGASGSGKLCSSSSNRSSSSGNCITAATNNDNILNNLISSDPTGGGLTISKEFEFRCDDDNDDDDAVADNNNNNSYTELELFSSRWGKGNNDSSSDRSSINNNSDNTSMSLSFLKRNNASMKSEGTISTSSIHTDGVFDNDDDDGDDNKGVNLDDADIDDNFDDTIVDVDYREIQNNVDETNILDATTEIAVAEKLGADSPIRQPTRRISVDHELLHDYEDGTKFSRRNRINSEPSIDRNHDYINEEEEKKGYRVPISADTAASADVPLIRPIRRESTEPYIVTVASITRREDGPMIRPSHRISVESPLAAPSQKVSVEIQDGDNSKSHTNDNADAVVTGVSDAPLTKPSRRLFSAVSKRASQVSSIETINESDDDGNSTDNDDRKSEGVPSSIVNRTLHTVGVDCPSIRSPRTVSVEHNLDSDDHDDANTANACGSIIKTDTPLAMPSRFLSPTPAQHSTKRNNMSNKIIEIGRGGSKQNRDDGDSGTDNNNGSATTNADTYQTMLSPTSSLRQFLDLPRLPSRQQEDEEIVYNSTDTGTSNGCRAFSCDTLIRPERVSSEEDFRLRYPQRRPSIEIPFVGTIDSSTCSSTTTNSSSSNHHTTNFGMKKKRQPECGLPNFRWDTTSADNSIICSGNSDRFLPTIRESLNTREASSHSSSTTRVDGTNMNQGRNCSKSRVRNKPHNRSSRRRSNPY